jgi:hypothetical protein
MSGVHDRDEVEEEGGRRQIYCCCRRFVVSVMKVWHCYFQVRLENRNR